MKRRRNAGRSDLPLMADINVTSLVDVAFTLLVIFIITAPVLQGGVEVTLPEARVRPLDTPDRPLVVTIQRDGQIYIEETAYTFEEFEAAFPQLVAAGDRRVAYIRGDTEAQLGRVLRVMAVAQAAGVSLSLIAEPEWTGRR